MNDTRPLRGLSVVEFGNFIAGPYACMLLADMGADVIKVEAVDGGDMARHTPPFVDGHSASFMALNRNKRSIALDLKTDPGREAAIRLIQRADALVENFRPGVMDKLGLGKEAMIALNPRLVYVAVSGFGQTSSERGHAAVNLIIEAASGTLSVSGEPGRMPVRPGIQTGDMIGALFAAYAALSGLLGAARHGEGRFADVSLIEASVGAAAFETAEYLATHRVPQPLGNRHRLTAPYQLFETRDARHIALGAPNDALFGRLCQVLGVEPLVADPRFVRYADRKCNEEELVPLIQAEVAGWRSDELVQALRRGERYAKAGADGIFIEAPESIEELETIGKSLDATLMANMLEGGRTPILRPAELEQLGFRIVIYGINLLMHATRTMRECLEDIRSGELRLTGRGVSFEEYKRIVGFYDWAALEDRYAR